jgi:hypothetical protein
MSHGRDKYRSRENRRLLRELFMREWDPIGVRDAPTAQDEYDNYIGEAHVMLMDKGATAEDMEGYLRSVEDYMGLTQTRDRLDRRQRVAESLIALRETFLTTH